MWKEILVRKKKKVIEICLSESIGAELRRGQETNVKVSTHQLSRKQLRQQCKRLSTSLFFLPALLLANGPRSCGSGLTVPTSQPWKHKGNKLDSDLICCWVDLQWCLSEMWLTASLTADANLFPWNVAFRYFFFSHYLVLLLQSHAFRFSHTSPFAFFMSVLCSITMGSMRTLYSHYLIII